MRAPTPVELTCADPAAPCHLPNIFLADPPLKKVVSRTLELRPAPRARREAARERGGIPHRPFRRYPVHQHERHGDQRRVLPERRRHAPAGSGARAGGRTGRVRFAARYARVNATFESPFTAFSPNNSSADATGDIRVEPGDRIPGIPRDTLKLRGEPDAFGRASFGATSSPSRASTRAATRITRTATGRCLAMRSSTSTGAGALPATGSSSPP